MKRLTITYDGRELYDGDVAEFTWKESDSEIVVTGRTEARPSLMDALKTAAAQAELKRGSANGTE